MMFYITMELAETQRKFKITSNDNSLVFSWKYPLQWYVISIVPGNYTIEQLNSEINQRVRELTGDSTAGSSHKIILFTNGTVFITSPEIIVDVYQSSILTVTGWPEHPSETNPSFLTYGNYSLEETL